MKKYHQVHSGNIHSIFHKPKYSLLFSEQASLLDKICTENSIQFYANSFKYTSRQFIEKEKTNYEFTVLSAISAHGRFAVLQCSPTRFPLFFVVSFSFSPIFLSAQQQPCVLALQAAQQDPFSFFFS
jgi:hypothetical protein